MKNDNDSDFELWQSTDRGFAVDRKFCGDPRASTEAENIYGDLTLDHVVIVTKPLGREWGAQVLAQIALSQAQQCPKCGELIALVRIGDGPAWWCETEEHRDNKRLIVNLVAEHQHDGDRQ